MRAHSIKKSYQILHCDQTGCEKFSAVAKILATRMLTCDLFAVANLLVAVWRGTQYRAFTPPPCKFNTQVSRFSHSN